MARFVPRRALAMGAKELRHIARDPQVLAFALLMPLVLLMLFGYAVSFDVEHIPLVVVDQDQTADSRALVRELTASETFVEVARRQAAEAVEPLFRRGVAGAALVIPPGYARDLSRGGDVPAQLLLDGSDNNTAGIALGYGNAIALEVTRGQLGSFGGGALAGELPLAVRVRTLFNPRLESAVFLVPGLIVVIMVMIAVMLTALTVAREYEQGSMEQLFATPVGRLEIILGKLGPYFAIGLVQVLLVVTVGVAVFGVPVRGSLLTLFVVSSLFLLGMLMQGLLISVVTRHQMIASQVAAITTMLPAMLLSGFIFPVDGMPAPLQVIARILPATYFVDALRAILLRGGGLAEIWPNILAMTAFFVVLLGVATKRFQRRLA